MPKNTMCAGMSEVEMRAACAQRAGAVDALVAISPERLLPSALALLLRLNDKPGFVVVDMADIDHVLPIAEASPSGSPVYLVHGPDRGDDLANGSPAEALLEILNRGRTPLTLIEGMLWPLQQPDVLERNHRRSSCPRQNWSCARAPWGAMLKSSGTNDHARRFP